MVISNHSFFILNMISFIKLLNQNTIIILPFKFKGSTMAVKKNFLLTIFLIIDILLVVISAEIIALKFSSLSKDYEKQLFDNVVNNKLWQDDDNIKTIPDGIIRVIWHKNIDDKTFTPILYDTNFYKKSDFTSRLSSNSLNVYKIQKDKDEYIAWIKPFSIQVCMRYIFIPILVTASIILFFNCAFILLFVPKSPDISIPENDTENTEDNLETKTYELTPEELEGLLGKDNEADDY